MRRSSYSFRIFLHTLLVLGCVVFAFPFYWLMATSFKEREEIFRYPPNWIPETPRPPVVSPYAARYDPNAEMSRPEPLDQARWPQVEGKIVQALWSKASDLIPSDVQRNDLPDLKGHLVTGLWFEIQKSLPDSTWRESDDVICAEASKRVTSDLFDKVWRKVYRSFCVKGATFEDVDLSLFTLPSETDFPRLWQARGKGARARLVGYSKPNDTKALLIGYDFSGGKGVEISAVVPLPLPPDRFRNVSLMLRADKSWHRLFLRIDLPGSSGVRSWWSSQPFLLANDLWQEVTWQVPSDEDKAMRLREYTLLGLAPTFAALTKPEALAPGTCRIVLALEPTSTPRAIYDKYTRNYFEASRYIPFWRYTANSVFLVIMNVIGQLFGCSLVAYAFARLKWPGREVCFGILLATMMLPGQVTTIPVFLIFKWLGWFNTLRPLWAPSFLGSAFFIFLLRQFMKTIPTDLEDAAKIDGCGFFGIYWRIILPLVKPALAAIAIFTFMGSWNDFMGPLIYVNDQRIYPLSLGLFMFQTMWGAEHGMLMAASALMTLPVVIMFFLAQRYFIQGVTLTGMKG
jgi:ABC-type glycerol-3-phosphate transport system permease component